MPYFFNPSLTIRPANRFKCRNQGLGKKGFENGWRRTKVRILKIVDQEFIIEGRGLWIDVEQSKF